MASRLREHPPPGIRQAACRARPQLARYPLLVIDLGLFPVDPDTAEGLYRLVDAAYEHRSVLHHVKVIGFSAAGRKVEPPGRPRAQGCLLRT